MTAAELVQSVRISEVFVSLGGGPVRRNRAQAFWRDGDGWNVALDDRKGTWFDFRDNRGGGVIDLIRAVLDCDRPAAASWLSTFAGVPLEGAKPESIQDRQKRQMANREAEHFLAWRKDYIDELRNRRNYCLSVYHAAARSILVYSLEHPCSHLWIDDYDTYEAKVCEFDQLIDAFVALSIEQQIQTFRVDLKAAA